jgi:hypothetical protein
MPEWVVELGEPNTLPKASIVLLDPSLHSLAPPEADSRYIPYDANAPQLPLLLDGHSLPEWVVALGGVQALSKLPRALLGPWLHSVSQSEGDSRYTPYGGGFLLLPLVLDLPLEEWMPDCPNLAEVPPDRALRALVLAKCQGRDNFIQFLRDPVWLEVLGLPPDTDWYDVVLSLKRLGKEAQRAWREGLAENAADHGAAPDLVRVLQIEQHSWRIRHDELGYWHSVASSLAGKAEVDADAQYLASPAELCIPKVWDQILTLAAQQLLRRFARCLPGFALSHFGYLYRNFLALSARVDVEDHRYLARLSRPPLALMLNITGMMRKEFDLPWHPDRHCALYPEDS